MKTLLNLLALGLLSAAPGFVVSTVNAQDVATNYWPFKVGNTWTLETKVGGQTTTQVITVTKITQNGNNSDATLDYKVDDQVVQTEVYRFDSKGISRVSSGPNGMNKLTPPYQIVKYPMEADKKWAWKGKIAVKAEEYQATSEVSTSGPETLKLPSGVFKAIRVHAELTIMSSDGGKTLIPNDYWFAPGVGLVQQKAKIGASEITGVLTSYKLAN